MCLSQVPPSEGMKYRAHLKLPDPYQSRIFINMSLSIGLFYGVLLFGHVTKTEKAKGLVES